MSPVPDFSPDTSSRDIFCPQRVARHQYCLRYLSLFRPLWAVGVITHLPVSFSIFAVFSSQNHHPDSLDSCRIAASCHGRSGSQALPSPSPGWPQRGNTDRSLTFSALATINSAADSHLQKRLEPKTQPGPSTFIHQLTTIPVRLPLIWLRKNPCTGRRRRYLKVFKLLRARCQAFVASKSREPPEIVTP